MSIDRRPLANGIPQDDILVVCRGATTATRLAVGSDVQPAADERSVWVKSFSDAHHCTLRELNLAGGQLRAPRPLPCSAALINPGERRALRWPSRIGGPQAGADEAAVDPSAKLIALSISGPAYELTGVQVTDVWLLDPNAARWQRLPDMPADVALKLTSMSWTSDGRLVMLAQTPTSSSASHELIAIWRPGAHSLAVRSVHIPARDSGSGSFIAWTRGSA